MKDSYKYDAFISYRHVVPDKPIAERLQKMLEIYSPPAGISTCGNNKKLRIFRDESELPTSNDLGGDIRSALDNSRFLIVICSPEYEKSKWCMSELEYFKKLHKGSNKNILTLLADDPDKRPTFPEPLRYETFSETLENGETVTSQRETEPLAANVSAKTLPQMFKKLKSEYLRIAAPLLGCGYDDLYNREQRRISQRKLRIALGISALLAVAVLLSTAALLAIRGKNRQIAADALELRKNNSQLLLKESEMLKKDGDLYGAIESAIRSFPEEDAGFAPLPGTINQLVSLTDAYSPYGYSSVRRVELPSVPRKICLFDKGKRLASVTGDTFILTDTETGETLKTLSVYSDLDVGFYCDRQIDTTSFTRIKFGAAGITGQVKGISYTDMMIKDLQDENQPNGNAIYIHNQNEQTLERISPDDGGVIWSFAVGEVKTLSIRYCSNESVIILKEDAFILLSPESGEIMAEISGDEIKALIGTIPYYAYYMNDYLVFTYNENDSKRFCVFRRSGKDFAFMYSSELFHDETIVTPTFLIRDETIFASGYACTGYIDSTGFLKAYDLNTGKLRWNTEEIYRNVNDPFIGFIKLEKEENDAFRVVFAAVGERLFSVNAETGEVLGKVPLPDKVIDMYYSGKHVFMTDTAGREWAAVPARVYDQNKTDSIYLYLIQDFSTEIERCAYCNNVYAICRNNDPAVILYRPAENTERDTLRRSANENFELQDIAFSPDFTLAAVSEAAPGLQNTGFLPDETQLYLIDTESKALLHTISFKEKQQRETCFLGNDFVSVKLYDGWTYSYAVYSTLSGELIQELTGDEYDFSSRFVFSPSGDVFLPDKNDMIFRIRPGDDPEKLSALDFTESSDEKHRYHQHLNDLYISGSGNKLILWIETSSVTVHESGTREDGTLYMDYDSTDPEEHLYLYDINTKTVTECAAEEMFAVSELKDCVFTDDEKSVYLCFKDNTIQGFSVETGKQICLAQYDGNVDHFFTIGSDLCVINSSGSLIKLQVLGSEITALNSISLYNGSLTMWTFAYTPMDGNRGLLKAGNAGAWIINPDTLEIIYEIDDCCGIDEERGLVYQQYQDHLYSYPLLSDDGLLALAKAKIGE
ncbi:MAG: TIR domain-containing protein [Clostridia bacterium]|nr:TIR domain-containing protein [Clostridia bacterium]